MATGMLGSMYAYPDYLEREYNVPLPDCMYTMQNLQTDFFCSNGPDLVAMKAKDSENAAVSCLIQRQEKFLDELSQLENEIDRLAKKAGIDSEMLKKLEKHECLKAESAKHAPQKELQSTQQDIDIVISAKPSDPPLSAFLLLNLLKQRGLQISPAIHIHSSLQENVPSNFQHCIGGKDQIIQPHSGLTITFIWKEENFGPTLLVSPRIQTPIRGDANVARYLCRMFASDLFESQNEDVVNLIDHWTSMATMQIKSGIPEQVKKAVQALEKRLANNKYLASDDINFADIVMWSAISVSNLVKSLTGNLKKWFLNCSEQFAPVSTHFFK